MIDAAHQTCTQRRVGEHRVSVGCTAPPTAWPAYARPSIRKLPIREIERLEQREAEEEAKRAAEEKFKRGAEGKAERAAYEKAEREAEEKAKREAEEQSAFQHCTNHHLQHHAGLM